MRKRDEPVRLTRIYTRGGDKGETSLGDGSRVSKLDPRVAAIGDVDELNSLVGLGGRPRARPERALRSRRRPVGSVRRQRGPAAHHGRRDRAARARDRRGERVAAGAEELCPSGRERARRAALPRASGLPPRGARRPGRAGYQPARGRLSQPPLRSSLRPRPRGERRSRRRRSSLAPGFHPLTIPELKDDAPSEGIRQEPEGDMAAVCDCKRLTILRRRLLRLTGCPAEGSDNFDRRFLCSSAGFACRVRLS